MGKMRLFEIHDQAWFPGFLRDQTTDALQFILNTGNLYGPIVHQLSGALAESGTVRILDLCSGAGGPWLTLSKALEQERGLPLHICLTDKYPNVKTSNTAKSLAGNGVRFHSIPVDATQIPDELNGFRTIFSSFHHFRPWEARAILQDAVNKQRGIGIFEVAGRSAVTVLLTFLMPIGSLLLTPFMRPFRWSRFLWTYILPVIPFVLWFDGIMSCLRAYSLKELIELTSGLTVHGYEWKIGQERNGLLPIPITYLIGYPIRETRESWDVRA
ncbi:MAG TPA: hypothetical protein VGR03_11445 [Candidatus Acidoferrum sp.]|nr:hypothetical protein [Candidatus Acidoferrum sp.]